MCTRPIEIQNPRFKWFKRCKDVKSVACGCCEECNDKKARSIYVRAREEYDACLREHGCGFMACLTYSPDLVPRFYLDGEMKMVFNKQHVIDFIKRLRMNLDRYFRRLYNVDAPDFKYLVTSEYGSDPDRRHQPHYHLLFFFRKSISRHAFRLAFSRCIVNQVTGERYFGYIYQCELLDPKQGGINYSSKYVCKDMAFAPQYESLKKRIFYLKREINSDFGIVEFPQNEYDDFKNRCIRSSKRYKDTISKKVLPLRHMMQFCMLSNDLGGSCIVEKYGKDLESLSVINFDGYPYSIPSIVVKRYEEKYGFDAKQRLVKNQFIVFLSRILSDFQISNVVEKFEVKDLLLFAKEYLQPLGNRLVIIQPNSISDPLSIDNGLREWDDIINEFSYFDDNDFFRMRSRIQDLIYLYSYGEMTKFREKLLHVKLQSKHEEYLQKKRNKAYRYV